MHDTVNATFSVGWFYEWLALWNTTTFSVGWFYEWLALWNTTTFSVACPSTHVSCWACSFLIHWWFPLFAVTDVPSVKIFPLLVLEFQFHWPCAFIFSGSLSFGFSSSSSLGLYASWTTATKRTRKWMCSLHVSNLTTCTCTFEGKPNWRTATKKHRIVRNGKYHIRQSFARIFTLFDGSWRVKVTWVQPFLPSSLWRHKEDWRV